MTYKFLFILFCFAFATLSYFFCENKKRWAWLVGAFFFTAWADYFLVIQDRHLPGVAVFCFAHICYIFRAVKNKRNFLLFTALATIFIIVAFFSNFLFLLVAMYASLFSLNICANIFSDVLPKTNKKITLVGLFLFMLCDINVLLLNLPRHLDFPRFPWAFTLIWVFYLPAQGLLAGSAIAFPKAKE